MIDKKSFAAGKTYYNALKPLPGYAIDHVNIEYVPYRARRVSDTALRRARVLRGTLHPRSILPDGRNRVNRARHVAAVRGVPL